MKRNKILIKRGAADSREFAAMYLGNQSIFCKLLKTKKLSNKLTDA